MLDETLNSLSQVTTLRQSISNPVHKCSALTLSNYFNLDSTIQWTLMTELNDVTLTDNINTVLGNAANISSVSLDSGISTSLAGRDV